MPLPHSPFALFTSSCIDNFPTKGSPLISQDGHQDTLLNQTEASSFVSIIVNHRRISSNDTLQSNLTEMEETVPEENEGEDSSDVEEEGADDAPSLIHEHVILQGNHSPSSLTRNGDREVHETNHLEARLLRRPLLLDTSNHGMTVPVC